MQAATQDVTLLDTDGNKTTVAIPRQLARHMDITELFDTANAVAEWLEDRPINAHKATEQDVADFIRYCL